MKKYGVFIPFGILILGIVFHGMPVFAGPVSEKYELSTYDFGSAGIASASSTLFGMFAAVGSLGGSSLSGELFSAGSGITYSQQADLPPAPTFTNPGATYDRLKLIINTGSNPEDARYAVAISKDGWATTQYIKSDFTIGETLVQSDFLTYPEWGSAEGKVITQLAPNTLYRVKVKAQTGEFTETGWGGQASAQTLTPSLSFGVSGNQLTFDSLSSANSYTDSSKQTTLSTSTNAYYGYIVYAYETGPLSYLTKTIADYPAPNSAPTAWTGTGFGYSTSDTALSGGAADRFTAGGPKYAGFVTVAPGDPVADHTAVVGGEPIMNEEHTVSYRVTVNPSQTAGVYKNTIIYVVVPTY